MATDEFAGLLSALQEPGSPELKDYEMQYALALEEARRRQRDQSQVPALPQRAKVSDLDRQSPEIRNMLERQYIEGMQPKSDTSQRFPPQPQSYADKLINATKKAYGALPAFNVSTRLSEPLRAPAEAAATLGTGSVALPAGALYGMARAVPEAISTKVFNRPPSPDVNKDVVKDTIEAMTYTPRTEGGQDIVGTLGKLFEESKAPHLWPVTPGRPLMTPEAMQVAGARTGMRLGEIKDIPTDIRMQQKGLTRRNIMDEPTIGAQLGKGIAATAEAFPQNRQDLGLLLESQSGAVRPTGTRVVQPQYPPETNRSALNLGELAGQDSTMELLRSFKNDVGYTYTLPHLRGPYSEGQVWAGAYMPAADYTELLPRDVSLNLEQAWTQHWRNYQKSLYPGVSTSEAELAFKTRFNTDEAYNNARNQQLEAFLQTDKAKEVIGDHYVATPKEYMQKLNDFDKWVENKVVKNFISSKLGTPEDPLIKLTAEGKGFRKKTGELAFDDSVKARASIQQKRTAAGFPAVETPTYLKAEETRTQLADLEISLEQVREEKAAAFQEGVELYGLENHADHAPFAAASQEEDRLNRKIKRTKEQYNNFMQAINYETLADEAIEFSRNLPETERDSFLANIKKSQQQFFEHTKRAPPTETLYSYMPTGALQVAIDRTIAEIGKKFLKNEITDKQLQNLDFPKAVAQVSETLADKLKLEEQKRQTYRDSVSKQALIDAHKFQKSPEPDGTRVIVIDNQNFTPDEITRLMSVDTAVLNHCMSNKGSTAKETHAFTGKSGTHYVPYADPVTGEISPDATLQMKGYIDGVNKGSSVIASFRDDKTGLPYASLQFRVLNNGSWTIHQFKGPDNGEIVDSAKRAKDIASFLNAYRHNIANDYDAYDLTVSTDANVVDTLHQDSVPQIVQALGIPSNEALKYDFYDGERRFLTKPELRQMYEEFKKGTRAPAVANPKPSLVNPSQQWEYVIDQGMQDVSIALVQERVPDADREEAATAYNALMHNGYIQVANDIHALTPDVHVNAINVGLDVLGMELSALLAALRYDLDNASNTRKALDAMMDAVIGSTKSPIITFLDKNRPLNAVLVRGTQSFSYALDWFFSNVVHNDEFLNTVDSIVLSTIEGVRQAGLTLESFYPVFDSPRADAFATEMQNQFSAADNPEYRQQIKSNLEKFATDINANTANGTIPKLIENLVEESMDTLPLFERTAYMYAASEMLRYVQEYFMHTDLIDNAMQTVATPTVYKFINDPMYVNSLHNREVPMPERFAQARAQQAPVQVVDMDIPEEPLVDDQGRLLADFEPEPPVQMPEGPDIVVRGRNQQPIPPLIGPEADAQPAPQPQIAPLAPVPVETLNLATARLVAQVTAEQAREVQDALTALREQNINDPVALNALPDIIAQYAIGPWAQFDNIQRALLKRSVEELIEYENRAAQRRLEQLGRNAPDNNEDDDIPFAQGGLVERPLTIDDMKYALMMRSA